MNIPTHEMDVDIQQAMLNESNNNVNASKGYESYNDADEKSRTSSDENDSRKENKPPCILQNHLKGKLCCGKTTGIKNKQKAAKGVRKTFKKSKKHGCLPSVLASKDMESLIDHVTSHKSKSLKKSSKGHSDDKVMHPVNHITKDSALGRAFEHINKESDSESSDSDSLSLSSDFSSLSPESSSSNSPSLSELDSSSKWQKCCHKSSKRKSAHRKQNM